MQSDFYFKFENKFRGDEDSILSGLEIYDSLIHQIICINGSWFVAHGSRPMPQGSWPIKNCREGPGSEGPRCKFLIGHEPGASRDEA